MYSRAICVKIWLWVAIILLFAALIAGIIYRVNKMTGKWSLLNTFRLLLQLHFEIFDVVDIGDEFW